MKCNLAIDEKSEKQIIVRITRTTRWRWRWPLTVNLLLWDISEAKERREQFLWRLVGHKAYDSWNTCEDLVPQCIRPNWVIQWAMVQASLVRLIQSTIGNKNPTFYCQTFPSRCTLPSRKALRCWYCNWIHSKEASGGLASDTSSSAPHAQTKSVLYYLAAYSPCHNRVSGSVGIVGVVFQLKIRTARTKRK